MMATHLEFSNNTGESEKFDPKKHELDETSLSEIFRKMTLEQLLDKLESLESHSINHDEAVHSISALDSQIDLLKKEIENKKKSGNSLH